MKFYAGTTISGVKVVFADRAQNSEHSHLVPADPADINLYFNGEMLRGNMKLNLPLQGATLTLHP